MLEVGSVLDHRYQIESVIGQTFTKSEAGNAVNKSVVYKALDLKAEMAVRAIKEICIRSEIIAAEKESLIIKEFAERDKNKLFFPNIIQKIKYEDGSRMFIVQDFIDGISMDNILKSGPVPQKIAVEYGKTICSLMMFIHKSGKIHSDMKPDNIMVLNSGETFRKNSRSKQTSNLKFIDFGSVVDINGKASAYTPEYAAPEQFHASRLDKRTDVFNVGATLFHMVTGRKPGRIFNGQDRKFVPSEERFVFYKDKDKNISSELQRIIRRCVEDKQDNRIKSCEDLYNELEKLEKHTHLKISVISLIMSLIFAGGSLASYTQANQIERRNYSYYINQAASSSDTADKIRNYEQAMKIDGKNISDYIELIELYENDLSFDEDEKNKILNFYYENGLDYSESDNSGRSEIDDRNYGKFMYELGKCYWYFYKVNEDTDISADNVEGIKESVKWFERAALSKEFENSDPSEYAAANVYSQIGDFYSVIQKAERESSADELYADIWKSIKNIIEKTDNDNCDTIVKAENYRMAFNTISMYNSKFAFIEIEKDDQLSLLSDICNGVKKLKSSSDRIQKISEYINSQQSVIRKEIEFSYKDSEKK